MMTSSIKSLFLLLLVFLVSGCEKDLGKLQRAESDKQPFANYRWSGEEAKFFSLSGQHMGLLQSRSGEMGYHPMLVEAFNKIAKDNEDSSFVASLAARIGYPIWSEAFVYLNPQNRDNLVLIPVAFSSQNKLSGFISVTKKMDGNPNSFIINGMSRQDLHSKGTGNAAQKYQYARWMKAYDEKLFNFSDPILNDVICYLEDRKVDPTTTVSPNPNCVWRVVTICTNTETHTWWYGSNSEFHWRDLWDGDHDNDGIPDAEDQDYGDFIVRFEDWWGNPENQLNPGAGADFASFWDGDHDNDGIQDDLDSDWWDWLKEFEQLYTGDGTFVDIGEFWGDIEDWIEDIFTPDPDCPDMDPIKELEQREIVCNRYYVLDCNTGLNGPNWWDAFSSITPCQNCPDDYNAYVEDQISQYLDYYRISNNYLEALVESSGNCDFFNHYYDCLSNHLIDDVLLRKYGSFSLSTAERNILINNPFYITYIYEFFQQKGYSTNTANYAHLIIDVISKYNTNGNFKEIYESMTFTNTAEQRKVVAIMAQVFQSPDLFDQLVRIFGDHPELRPTAGGVFTQQELEDEDIPMMITEALYEEVLILVVLEPGQSKAYYLSRACWNVLVNSTHTMLDICGLVPGYGEPCDFVNGVMYLVEGDGVNAGLSFAATLPIVGWVSTGIKHARRVITYAGKSVTLTYKVLPNGIIHFAGSLRSKMGLKVGDPFQAHHLIPQQYAEHQLVQKAAKAASEKAFHMNDPKFNGFIIENARHANHPAWNAQVFSRMQSLNQANPNWTPEQAAEAIREVQRACSQAIFLNPTKKINEITITWF